MIGSTPIVVIMKKLWISCGEFTGKVVINDKNIIVDAMFICKKFVGQPLNNLLNWANKNFGTVDIERFEVKNE